MTETLIVDRPQPGLVVLQLNRPKQLNAINEVMRDELTHTLAAIGARMLKRPVKVAMTRPQVFHMTTHRSASEQHLRLGASPDGRLTAYGQDALVQAASFDDYVEPVMLAAVMIPVPQRSRTWCVMVGAFCTRWVGVSLGDLAPLEKRHERRAEERSYAQPFVDDDK